MILKSKISLLTMVGLCLTLAGCGGSSFDMTKVSGAITIGGSPPPYSGRIIFTPVEGTGKPDTPTRPGTGPFKTDGQYVVSSFEDDDGLLPGTYTVSVKCYSGMPADYDFEKVSVIAKDWKADDVVITGEESELVLNYDIPPKK